MSALSKELDRYLTIRRSLGYDLGTTERILRRFITFAEQEDAEYISTRSLPAMAGDVRQCEPAYMGVPLGNSSALCPVAAWHRSEA